MSTRIMTSNIWGSYFGNELTHREDQLFEVYMKYTPDVIGIQEVTKAWHDSALMTGMRENDNPVRGEDGFYHGKTTANPFERSFDHIVGTGDYTVANYYIVTDQPAPDATDHSPVFVDISF